jgi:RNA binding exosome subunit
LSRALPIAYVDISCFAHATEDERKVLDAVRHLLPTEYVEDVTFEKSNLRGHFGNPILLYESKIRDKRLVTSLVENLAANLTALDKEILLGEIELHVEKGSLYIRLDKQAALEGSFRLATADPIRIRLRFNKNRLEDIVEVGRQIGMFPR